MKLGDLIRVLLRIEQNPIITGDPEIFINGKPITRIYAEAKTREIMFDVKESLEIKDIFGTEVGWEIHIE